MMTRSSLIIGPLWSQTIGHWLRSKENLISTQETIFSFRYHDFKSRVFVWVIFNQV